MKKLCEKTIGNTGHVADHNELASRVRNVLDFGAVGDGVHDDTTAVQNAINTGKVYLPKGTYKITSQLTYDPLVECQGLQIIGDGLDTVFDNQVANKAMLKIGGHVSELNKSDMQMMGRVYGFQIKTTSNKNNSSGIEISSSWLGVIKNIKVFGLSADGIRVVNTENDQDSANNLTIKNCDIRNCGNIGINFVYNQNCIAVGLTTIRNCYVCGNKLGIYWRGITCSVEKCQIAYNVDGGFLGGYADTIYSQQLTLVNNEFDNNGNYHISICAGNDVLILQNRLIHKLTGDVVQPATAIIIGDGGSGYWITNVCCMQNRTRNDTDLPITSFDIKSNANHCLMLDNYWQPSGGTPTKYIDGGARTMIRDNGIISLRGLSIYANSAAAKSAGLIVGDIYRSGTNPDYLCVVS